MIKPGESIDGYRIIRLIGSGGFGEVWLCQAEAVGDLRALKFIPAGDPERLQKEFDALCRYRTAAGQLHSPSIMPIEHVNRRTDGLFYIMPLSDGFGADDPLDPAWSPLTLDAIIENRRGDSAWFTSEVIVGYITPIFHALQLLSDASLVHRDVKPENILFLHGSPCLGDISLLGEDSHKITRRGTPGYSAPSWFVGSGGHPDMFGAATTLYSLLTGNPPDKMGRAAFRWPPQGEGSLLGAERQEWLRIHGIIRRAVDERPEERFRSFESVATALNGAGDPESPRTRRTHRRLLVLAGLAILILIGVAVVMIRSPLRKNPEAPASAPRATQNSDPSNPAGLSEKELADYRATASLASIFFSEKDYQSALDMVNQLNRTYPVSDTFPYYSTLRAQCLYQLGRHEEAHAELRRGLLGKRLDLASFGARMKLWDRLGDLQGAEDEVSCIIDKYSPITMHYMARARLRLRRGDFAGAEQDIVAASTIDNDPERAALVAKFRSDYAEDFPEYARYLAAQGIETKKASIPKSPPEASLHRTPAALPHQTQPATPKPDTDLSEYRDDLQQFDKALKQARTTLIYPHELIAAPVDIVVTSLKKIIKDAPSHREVARQLADLARQMESSLGKVSPQPDDETIAQGIAPLEVLAKKMKTIPKTADQRVKYDWDVRPLVDGQIDKLRQDIEAEGNFRYQQCEKIIQATTPFLNKYTSRPDADGSWNFSSPIQKATSSLMGSGNKLCKQGK